MATCYGGPNKDVKGVNDIKTPLNKPEGSGVYLLMADNKAKYHRAQLSHLLIELEKQSLEYAA